MLLAIDIGNTHIVLGLFQGKALRHTFRIATALQNTADEYGIAIGHILNVWNIPIRRIKGVVVSSVVPVLTPIFEEMGLNVFGRAPLVVTASLDTGITLAYPRPDEVGADRIVNAAAAVHFFGRAGAPMIIIDFGTATTFDLVSARGEYFGGAIAPGLMISATALSSRAAKLPVIDLVVPKNVMGQDTLSSMQSGLVFGHVGLVHEIVRQMTSEIPHLFKGLATPNSKLKTQNLKLPKGLATPNSKLKTQNLKLPKVIATGGLAPLIAPLCKEITVVKPTLTLDGLMIIYRKHCA